MTEFKDGFRIATTVLVNSSGLLLGQLAPIKLSTPWYQEVSELNHQIKLQHGIYVTIIRLLDVDASHLPEIEVTYLAQAVAEQLNEVELSAFDGQLDEHTLRLPYARPGGPDADIAWASEVLSQSGSGKIVGQQQIRTWNLSSIWKLRTAHGLFWLKSVPPFFAHEGAVLKLLAGEKVPQLLAADGQRILMRNLQGDDCYQANVHQMLYMLESLIDLQWRWHDRMSAFLEIGLPAISNSFLEKSIAAVIDAYSADLAKPVRLVLDDFLSTLAARLKQIDDCGMPITLVHGDYHPGNWKGRGMNLTILDWGDCCIGHPLLDMPGLLDRTGSHGEQLKAYWLSSWKQRIPHSDVELAGRLIEPVAKARMAVVYQHFLLNIEPSERIYHASDPLSFLNMTAAVLARQ